MVHLSIINATTFCPPEIIAYIVNHTSSYTEQRNEATVVPASVIMFVLAGLFFNLNLFSGISDVSSILDPKVRIFLTSALSLFLPVMSYLFSEAKNSTGSAATAVGADLPLRAGLILACMLLVELLRKKVDEIRMRGYSGTIQRAGRVVWLGSLVFVNIQSTGRKAVFSILWILCATKLVQRTAFREIVMRSYAHGKNARVISSYMDHVLQQDEGHHQEHPLGVVHCGSNDILKRCKYIVMGEEELVEKPTADGYKLTKIDPDHNNIVTVGKVWELAEKDELFTTFDKNQRLKRLCLSFALFKLLRRRFEHLPAMTDGEAHNCRSLILKGLYINGGRVEAEALFQVMNDEVKFLSEYYHSVVPVVLVSPFFLLTNYFLVPVVVTVLCLMTIILCGNGEVIYAFRSIAEDYTVWSGIGKTVICLLTKATHSPSSFFFIVDLFTTVLLFIIFFYEEIWEFFVFLLSNWFMVSLLYNFTKKPHWLRRPTFRGAFLWGGFRVITWTRSKMHHGNLRFKQFSVLNLRWPLMLSLFATFSSLAVKTELVPNNVKKSIMDYLVEHDRGTSNYTPLANGKFALRRHGFAALSWACESDSVSEVMLTWHIATSILDVERPGQSHKEEAAFSQVATRLSKYCAYLVAFHPEVLLENPDQAGVVFEEMKEELKRMVGCREYYLSSQHTRVKKILREKTTDQDNINCKVVRNGVKLGKSLMEEESKWKLLADVWTELIVFVAPSNDEDRVKGHKHILVQGGEFITVLWALTTHMGISRPSTKEVTTGDHLEIA